jgi:hypothetical protein
MPLPGFEQVPHRRRDKAYYVNIDSVSTESSSGERRETSTLLWPLEELLLITGQLISYSLQLYKIIRREIVGK